MTRRLHKLTFFVIILLCASASSYSFANQPKRGVKSKFYDFNEQLIDGEIKKPTALYTDSRQKVKFDRLLKLKKSFMPQLFKTAKEKVFK